MYQSMTDYSVNFQVFMLCGAVRCGPVGWLVDSITIFRIFEKCFFSSHLIFILLYIVYIVNDGLSCLVVGFLHIHRFE